MTCLLSEKDQIQIALSLCHREILSKTEIWEKEFDWSTREKVNENRVNISVWNVVLWSWGEEEWWHSKATAQQYGFLS